MTAMPRSSGRRTHDRHGRAPGRDSYQEADAPDKLAVIYERLDATDETLAAVSQQNGEIVKQLSAQSGAIQVLATNDTNLKAQVEGHAAELREWQKWRLDFIAEFTKMQVSLEVKIQQAVITALEQSRSTERHAADSRARDNRVIQEWLFRAVLVIMGALLTYFLTHR